MNYQNELYLHYYIKVLNHIILINDELEIINEFNLFFSYVFSSISNKIKRAIMVPIYFIERFS